MGSNITYRKAKQNDVSTVTDLLSILYGVPQDELLSENEKLVSDANMAFFLALDGDKPVGILHSSLRREYVNGTNDGLKGYLEAVYILPEYRLHGIAAKLVKEAWLWAGQNGCREFASDCLLDNTDSYKFHLKMGFEETERNIFFLKIIEPMKVIKKVIYEIHGIDAALRKKIQPVFNETWGAPELAVGGRLWDSRIMPGLAATGGNGDILGYLLYEYHDGLCEIMALESIVQNIGIASALIEEVRRIAKSGGVSKVIVQTSNDNTHAIRFYQRRGFTIRAVRLGALAAARQLKPAIPLIGIDGIPLRDEIEFEIDIT